MDRRYRGESLAKKVASVYRRYDSPKQIIAAAYADGLTTSDPTLAARYIAINELQEEELDEIYSSCDGMDADEIIEKIERMAI